MRVFALFVTFKMSQIWNRKKFLYIYIYIYINLPKLGFYGLDTVPFRPCIFTDFLILYIFCTILQYLLVLQYVYIHVEKIKKKHGAEKQKKIYLYINTKSTAELAFTAKLYIF